jgi:Fe2+ transport system protein FeoA
MSLTLADLKPGQRGVITGFVDEGPLVQRIMQLGLLEDVEVALVRNAPAGDPLEIVVAGYALSIRRDEARLVKIRDAG